MLRLYAGLIRTLLIQELEKQSFEEQEATVEIQDYTQDWQNPRQADPRASGQTSRQGYARTNSEYNMQQPTQRQRN